MLTGAEAIFDDSDDVCSIITMDREVPTDYRKEALKVLKEELARVDSLRAKEKRSVAESRLIEERSRSTEVESGTWVYLESGGSHNTYELFFFVGDEHCNSFEDSMLVAASPNNNNNNNNNNNKNKNDKKQLRGMNAYKHSVIAVNWIEGTAFEALEHKYHLKIVRVVIKPSTRRSVRKLLAQFSGRMNQFGGYIRFGFSPIKRSGSRSKERSRAEEEEEKVNSFQDRAGPEPKSLLQRRGRGGASSSRNGTKNNSVLSPELQKRVSRESTTNLNHNQDATTSNTNNKSNTVITINSNSISSAASPTRKNYGSSRSRSPLLNEEKWNAISLKVTDMLLKAVPEPQRVFFANTLVSYNTIDPIPILHQEALRLGNIDLFALINQNVHVLRAYHKACVMSSAP